MSISARPALPAVAALVIVAATYSNVGAGTYVWDDRPLILEEPAVHQLTPVRYFTQPFWQASPYSEGHDVYYRPLTTLTYAVDWSRGEGSAAPFHAVNLALHLAVCAVVAFLARLLGASPVAAALAAAVFGTLPRLAESVSWISGRTDVLAVLLGLTAIALHLSNPDRAWRRVGAGALLLLGLFAKEVALAAAVGIVAIEVASARGRGWPSAFRRSAPALLAVGAYVAIRLAALRSLPGDVQLARVALTDRLAMALQAPGHYVLMVLDPFRPRLQIGVAGHPEPAIMVVGALALVLAAALAWRTLPRAAPGVCGLVVTAAASVGLVLHLLPIRLGVVAADRFLYLPLAALSIVAAVYASRSAPAVRLAVGLAALVAVPPLAFATFQRSAQWADEVELWRHAVATTPESNPLPLHEYGSALARAGRLEEAIVAYQRAADLSTGRRRVSALVDVATTLSDKGELDAGVARMRAAMALAPPLPSYHYNLAILEARRLQFGIAEAELLRATAMLPSYGAARDALGWVRSAREGWSALPPRTESEAPGVQARRAALFVALGVPTEAARLWRNVAQHPGAAAEDLLGAARFFLAHGEAQDVRRALDRAGALGAEPARLAVFRNALDQLDGGE